MLKGLPNALAMKSKTVNYNILAGALVTITSQFGFPVSPELISAGFVILNTILRLITKQPLEDK